MNKSLLEIMYRYIFTENQYNQIEQNRTTMAAFQSDEGVFSLLSGLEMKLKESQLALVEEALARLSMDSVEVLTSEDADEVVTKKDLSAALVKVGMDELEVNGVSLKVISALKKKHWVKQGSKGSAGGDAAGGAASSSSDEPSIVVGHNSGLCVVQNFHEWP